MKANIKLWTVLGGSESEAGYSTHNLTAIKLRATLAPKLVRPGVYQHEIMVAVIFWKG